MKILVVSDSHGKNENLLKVIQKVSPIDLMIFLGDCDDTEEQIREMTDCPVEMVAGNNDYDSTESIEKIITVGIHPIFMTHGHWYHVNSGLERMEEAAWYRGADIAMFGHTHKPLIKTDARVTLINPGSISLPRQEGRIPTYIIMEIDKKGEAHYSLNYLSS